MLGFIMVNNDFNSSTFTYIVLDLGYEPPKRALWTMRFWRVEAIFLCWGVEVGRFVGRPGLTKCIESLLVKSAWLCYNL